MKVASNASMLQNFWGAILLQYGMLNSKVCFGSNRVMSEQHCKNAVWFIMFCPTSMLSVKQTFLAIKSYDFGSIEFFKP